MSQYLAVVTWMYTFPDLHGLIPPLTGCCIDSAVNIGRNTKNAGNNSESTVFVGLAAARD